MKVAAFNGSPRSGGNTETLLWEALRPIEYAGHEVAKFNLNDMDVRPCQDCGGCEGTGICVFHDDMEMISDTIRKSDRIVLASPIFFFGLSAQSKTMIDRCQAFWCEKYLMKKPIPEGPEGRERVAHPRRGHEEGGRGRMQRGDGEGLLQDNQCAAARDNQLSRGRQQRRRLRACNGPRGRVPGGTQADRTR